MSTVCGVDVKQQAEMFVRILHPSDAWILAERWGIQNKTPAYLGRAALSSPQWDCTGAVLF